MPSFYNISDWTEQPWYNTGGTRAKKYFLSPDGKFYYFKRSYSKPNREYVYEFWSEIIAHGLGQILGIDVLKYDIAFDGNSMGCISENMINANNEELIEAIQLIKALNPAFDPTIKEHKTWYSFDLIKRALIHSKISEEVVFKILEMIVFDAIIGNGDRHQENWAIISKQILTTEILAKIPDQEMNKAKWWERLVVAQIKKKQQYFKEKHTKKELPKSFYLTLKTFAPIYDSGSSLGRELSAEKIIELLQSNEKLNHYVNNGLSEIH